MRAATVEDVAQEFMRILAEGWSPDPEEFLHRVPEDLREECRARLNELLGEADEARAAEAEAAHEPEQTDDGIDEEMIVFELDGDGPIQTVRVPSIDANELAAEEDYAEEPEEMLVEAEQDYAADLVGQTSAIAEEAALEPEPEQDEYEDELEADSEPETAEVAQPEAAAPIADEPETAELAEPEVEEPIVEESAVEEAPVEEPIVEETFFEDAAPEEPAAPVEKKPEGLVKLTPAEAKAMFDAMDRVRGKDA